MNEPWYKSKTKWGGVLIGGSVILSSVGGWLAGSLSADQALAGVAAGIGTVLTIVGIRSAIA